MPRGLTAFGASFNYILPAEMCKRLVGLGHLVHLVALANGVALPLIGLQISAASASRMGVPLRASAKSTIQRSASAACRSDGTSNGT